MKIVKFDDRIEYHNELGQRHREDGPAVECLSGHKLWYQNGQLHRIDGPAREYANGNKFWYQNNQLHRLDGPAFDGVDEKFEYYIYGREYTEFEFKFFSQAILGNIIID